VPIQRIKNALFLLILSSSLNSCTNGGSPSSYSFRIEIQPDYPSYRDVGVRVNANIGITFSKDGEGSLFNGIDDSKLVIELFDQFDKPVVFRKYTTFLFDFYLIMPERFFEPNQTYTIKVSGAVPRDQPEFKPQAVEAKFTTGSVPSKSPQVVCSSNISGSCSGFSIWDWDILQPHDNISLAGMIGFPLLVSIIDIQGSDKGSISMIGGESDITAGECRKVRAGLDSKTFPLTGNFYGPYFRVNTGRVGIPVRGFNGIFEFELILSGTFTSNGDIQESNFLTILNCVNLCNLLGEDFCSLISRRCVEDKYTNMGSFIVEPCNIPIDYGGIIAIHWTDSQYLMESTIQAVYGGIAFTMSFSLSFTACTPDGHTGNIILKKLAPNPFDDIYISGNYNLLTADGFVDNCGDIITGSTFTTTDPNWTQAANYKTMGILDLVKITEATFRTQ